MTPAAWSERRQVPIYLGALLAGASAGWLAPAGAAALAPAINPVLAVLLYATFLQIPARGLVQALRPGRFQAAVLVLNFAVVPAVVAGLFVLLPADEALRLGVLLVLLTPCVDYVIVFAGLAGGCHRRLAATTPLLLLVQLALLPVFLPLFTGSPLAEVWWLGPFVEAFVFLIAVPLTLAWLTQSWAARRPRGRATIRAANTTLVPLTALALFTVAASQAPALRDSLTVMAAVIPVYVAFALLMGAAGAGVSRLFRLGVPDGRAVVFSGVARNSLVVLPLALALPDGAAVAVVVIVTQTLVEVLTMVLCVHVVPRLVPFPMAHPMGRGARAPESVADSCRCALVGRDLSPEFGADRDHARLAAEDAARRA